MNKKIFIGALFASFLTVFSSCTTLNNSMREPNSRVEFSKSDFSLSSQVTGEAKTVKVLGIDFERLFKSEAAKVEGGSASSLVDLASLPVIGNFVSDKTANYSLYNLMTNNPGYDVIFYPQYETEVVKPVLGLGFITKITTVKTKARLGKLNN